MEVGELIYMTAHDLWHELGALELLHHVVGIIAEAGCLVTMNGIPYMLWVHLAQATQPFLYLSWTLHQAKVSRGLLLVASAGTCVTLCTPCLRHAPPTCASCHRRGAPLTAHATARSPRNPRGAGIVLRVGSVLLLLRSLWRSGVTRREFDSQAHWGVSFGITLVFAALNVVWLTKLLGKIASVTTAKKPAKSD
jgi:hypothetical protein